MDRTGNKVGQYIITKEIGRGAFGDAYECRNEKKENLALKMIAKDLSVISQIYFESSNASKEVLAEICALVEVDHKFVLKFVEVFKDSEKGRWCMVTELYYGDLSRRINEKIEWKQIFSAGPILHCLAKKIGALKHLHAKHLLHRDLKPENFFSTDKLIELGDLGLSNFCKKAVEVSVCGTPACMAPEVHQGNRYHEEFDIWSFCKIGLELCSLHADTNKTNKLHSEYYKSLQSAIQSIIEENPHRRPTAEVRLQIEPFMGILNHIETRSKTSITTQTTPTSYQIQAMAETANNTASTLCLANKGFMTHTLTRGLEVMDENRKEKFLAARSAIPKSILSKTQVLELCNILVAEKEMSDATMIEITNEQHPIEMMTKVMQVLSSRGNKAYDVFRDGLFHINAPRHSLEVLPDFACQATNPLLPSNTQV